MCQTLLYDSFHTWFYKILKETGGNFINLGLESRTSKQYVGTERIAINIANDYINEKANKHFSVILPKINLKLKTCYTVIKYHIYR